MQKSEKTSICLLQLQFHLSSCEKGLIFNWWPSWFPDFIELLLLVCIIPCKKMIIICCLRLLLLLLKRWGKHEHKEENFLKIWQIWRKWKLLNGNNCFFEKKWKGNWGKLKMGCFVITEQSIKIYTHSIWFKRWWMFLTTFDPWHHRTMYHHRSVNI